MNKLFGGSLVVWSALTFIPAIGLADTGSVARFQRSPAPCNLVKREVKFRRWAPTRGQQVMVPELDPGAAGQALALLLGGSAVLLDRARRRAR
jgi:hypothetical protein